MAFCTLCDHLRRTRNPPLPWIQRLKISIEPARGLHYLHTGAGQTIIHRDVKSTNIILDERMVAKVSDFGLSKKLPSLDDTHVSTGVKGSFGYYDPEYYERRQVTPKSDVYSFSVVLLEVLCDWRTMETSVPDDEINLAHWAKQCHKKGKLEDIMDPYVKGEIYPNCYRKFVKTTMKCLNKISIGRQSMGDVLYELDLALAIQADPKESPTYVMTNLGGSNIFSNYS